MSNTRYSTYNQLIFTAGDEEQFFTHINDISTDYIEQINIKDQTTQLIPENIPSIYRNPTDMTLIHTFRYMFHKFKKGIFVQIKDNRLHTFLPFSKYMYLNDWGHIINMDNFIDICKQCCQIENRHFNIKHIETNPVYWYANDAIFRYERPLRENESGIKELRDMFETLCAKRTISDAYFFVNKRDHPLLRYDYCEPYTTIYPNTTIRTHLHSTYTPIFSMCSTDEYADIMIPTWDDWVHKDIECPQIQNSDIEFDAKVPKVVFRGATTGYSVDRNDRVRFSLLSLEYPDILDIGIVKWNARPRLSRDGNKLHIKTFDPSLKYLLPLVPFLTDKEQSRYKYILHLAGHTQAYRLRRELGYGSVILMVESPYKLWYSDYLKPYVHYVPVTYDDILDKYRWCEENQYTCKEIVQNALRLYEELNESKMLDVLQDKVNLVSSLCVSMSQCRLDDVEEMLVTSKHKHKCNVSTKSLDVVYSNKNTTMYLDRTGGIMYKETRDRFQQYHEVFVYNNLKLEGFRRVRGINCDGLSMCEYVYGSTLKEYIESDKFNMNVYISILAQTCVILHNAYTTFKFTHYDMMPWNVIVSTKYTNKTYRIDRKHYTFSGCLVPTIIDLGKSTIYVDAKKHPFIHYHVPIEIHDFLVLLMSSLDIILQRQLSQSDMRAIFTLIKMVNKTSFVCYKDIKSLRELKSMVKIAKRYSYCIDSTFEDLEHYKLLDVYDYIKRNFKL